MLPYLFGFLLFRLERLICDSEFSPGISLSVCSCSVSSSGLVRIGTYLLSLSDMSYTIGVPVSSAFLHRLHPRRHRQFRFLPVFYFGRFSIYRSGCPEGFHPNGRISRPVRVGSVDFWG